MTSAELRAAIQGLRSKRASLVDEKNDAESEQQKASIGEDLKRVDRQLASLARQLENADALEKATAPGPTPKPLTQAWSSDEPRPNRPQAQQMQRIVAPRVGRLRAFRGPNATRDALAVGQWMRANLFGSADAADWLKLNAPSADLNEGTPGDGGYLTPDLIASTILDVVEQHGVAMRLCQVLKTESDVVSVPKRNAGPAVEYPGEAGLIAERSSSFGEVELTPTKRAILTYISRELLDDAVVNMADFAMREMGRELALQMDNEFINGDGTGSYGGVTGLSAALGDGGSVPAASAWGSFTMAHFSAAKSALADKYHANARWLMSRAFHAQTVMRLLHALGGATALEGATLDARKLFAYPIEFCDYMPRTENDSTDACFFGDFEASCLLALRTDVKLERSEHYRFAYDQLAIRATVRYDVSVHRGGSHAAADGYIGLRETS